MPYLLPTNSVKALNTEHQYKLFLAAALCATAHSILDGILLLRLHLGIMMLHWALCTAAVNHIPVSFK